MKTLTGFVVCLALAPLAALAGPIKEVDLASDGAGSATGTEWTLSIDGGPARPIKVPAGGWNSDLQSPRIDKNRDVKDHVIYERKITIPDYKGDRVVKLMFGAVNHGAEVYLNDNLVATHAGPMTPFEADITDIVKPGATCQLKVKAYHRRHYKGRVPIGFDYPSDKPGAPGYTSKFAYGMTKYVKLAILPQVYIKDVFVRPSVSNDNLHFDVWVHNAAPSEKTLTLEANLTSWNKDSWAYPVVAGTNVKIEPKSVKKITVGPVQWGLGSKSYWWPNVPFDETYTAKLHLLNLSIKEGQVSLDKRSQRFGFCDYAEGPYYYTINGVRVNSISDATAEGQMSYYDCYSMAPAFLPPTGPNTGCPETWRRYMRAGMNVNRIHQSMPTEYMMDAADEVGFMLIPEPGIRGYAEQVWDGDNLPQAIKEMAWLCRNHPCVIRYSLNNEWSCGGGLIGPILEEDARRPLVAEGSESSTNAKGHAFGVAHYSDYPRPARAIFGMGEFAWRNGTGADDGMAIFADQGRDMRLNDVCYFAGWSWMNWWPNFLEGMDYEHHGWLKNRCADRRDGADGWGSHIIQYVQRSCHPYLVMDHAIETMNHYNANWPTTIETIMPGDDVVRKIEMFNDVLSGNRLALRWTLHWDSAAGESVASETIKDIAVEPGFHVTQTLKFKVPDPGKEQRRLFIVLESLKQDSVVYKEDRIFVNVSRTAVKPDVKFIGIDRQTQGDWQKKYGTEGHETIGRKPELPGYAKLEWLECTPCLFAGATTDVRALTYFANPMSDKDRIAAFRYYAKALKLTLDVGDSYHNIAIYMLDWDRKKRKQVIEMQTNGAMILDTRTVDDFTEGKYLIWRIRGKVLISVKPLECDHAVISGVFFDPPER